ncbi:MAG: hypothetical protein ACTHQE_07780 [Thermomicrobiales bacterium]
MRELDSPIALQTALATAIRDMPGAVELRAFGSLTRTGYDRYSDVDLEVLTTDFAASTAARQAVIGRVAPVWVEWRIHPSRSAWAATVLFDGLSPFHHLDLGITPVATSHSIEALDARTVLWTQPPAPAHPGEHPTMTYAPDAGTSEHTMLEHLLSALRYVKARKRGQIFTAYRFASALATASFAMLEASRTNDLSDLRRKTSTTSFVALDRQLPEAERLDLLGLLDFSRPERMDTAVLSILQHNLTLYDALPGASRFPPEIPERLLAVVTDELYP